MTFRQDRFELPLRLVAAAIIVASLGILNAIAGEMSQPTDMTTVFLLVFSTCSSFMLIARGLGVGVAAGLGVVIAVSISLALANFAGSMALGHAAFTLAATSVLVLVGRIAGATDRSSAASAVGCRRVNADRSRFQRDAGTGAWGRRHLPEPTVEQTLGALVTDFCVWTETEAATPDDEAAPIWPAFGRFVRQTLRNRLGARDIDLCDVVDDGSRLRPIVPPSKLGPTAVTTDGPLGYAIRSGHVYCAPTGAKAGAEAPTWEWILPLRSGSAADAVVTVGGIDQAEYRRPSVGHAVRDLFQLCWFHVRGMQALRQARRTDAPTGLLLRSELLGALREDHQCELRRGEPLAVLTLALEGLRRLDDGGQWAERDELVSRLGYVLRASLNAGDLVARFADDRFVAVMQRTASDLARVTAERLLLRVRREVLEHVDPQGGLGIRLRAGLTSDATGGSEPEALISRAVSLLDDARTQGVDFAVDPVEHAVATTGATTAPN